MRRVLLALITFAMAAASLPAAQSSHRIILNFEGEAEGVDPDRLIGDVIQAAEGMSHAGKDAFLR